MLTYNHMPDHVAISFPNSSIVPNFDSINSPFVPIISCSTGGLSPTLRLKPASAENSTISYEQKKVIVSTTRNLIFYNEAQSFLQGEIKTFAYETIDQMYLVSEKCRIPIVKILVYLHEDSDFSSNRLHLTACFDSTSENAALLWDTFSEKIDGWVSTKSESEKDMIFDKLSATFRWEN